MWALSLSEYSNCTNTNSPKCDQMHLIRPPFFRWCHNHLVTNVPVDWCAIIPPAGDAAPAYIHSEERCCRVRAREPQPCLPDFHITPPCRPPVDAHYTRQPSGIQFSRSTRKHQDMAEASKQIKSEKLGEEEAAMLLEVPPLSDEALSDDERALVEKLRQLEKKKCTVALDKKAWQCHVCQYRTSSWCVRRCLFVCCCFTP